MKYGKQPGRQHLSLRNLGGNAPVATVSITSLAIYYQCTLMHSDPHVKLIAQHTSLKTLEA